MSSSTSYYLFDLLILLFVSLLLHLYFGFQTHLNILMFNVNEIFILKN